jgi:hypothetical protein
MEAKVGAFLRGQTILGASVAGMGMLAYALIGLPNVLLLGLIAGVLEAVRDFARVGISLLSAWGKGLVPHRDIPD